MKNDILPTKKRVQGVVRPASVPPAKSPVAPVSPRRPNPPLPPVVIEEVPDERLTAAPHRVRRVRKWLWLVGILLVIVTVITAPLTWYNLALRAVNPSDTTKVRVEITSGSSLSGIGKLLEEKKLIRSSFAFDIYTRLGKAGATLQAGTYSFSASQPMNEIITQLIAGHVNHFSLTFLPGSLLVDPSSTPLSKKTDVQSVLLRAGYLQKEIDAAFMKSYDSPLFVDKPLSASLEGYIYGETYDFDANSTVEQVLSRTFEEYHKKLTENNIIDGIKAQGLSLHEGITLASMVQREVTSSDDQAKVAQVFLTRLKIGMPLGSDVTYQYAAKMRGVAPTPELDSTYNTRKVVGLPPGPIALPGIGALKAVARPATTDFLYFLSGDDDVTYFAHTDAEHAANAAAHCKIKCAIN